MRRLETRALAALFVLVALALGCAVALAAERTGTKGNDIVVGTRSDDTLNGLAGDDRLVGDAGDDELLGGAGDDTLDGGAGSDRLRGGAGPDVVIYPDDQPIVVTINDAADDGRAGERDNVRTDVEDVYGTQLPDRITGSDATNTLDGGAGDDYIDGGGGADGLYGDAGNDRIVARDDVRDEIDCGDGDDVVVADERDRTFHCEIVEREPAVPRVYGNVNVDWAWKGALTRNTLLTVTDLQPRRTRIEVRCRGEGCRAKRRHLTANGQVSLTRLLRGVRLRRGAVVEVRMTARGRIGKMVRFRVRKGVTPSYRWLCLSRGSGRPFTRNCPIASGAR